MDPRARIAALRGRVPFNFDDAVLVESWSNDAWLTTETVLRICWRGDRNRLDREQQLLRELPATVPHAAVLGSGTWDDGTWLLLRRLPGERLDLVWPTLSLDERRRVLRRLGELLRSLHQWSPPPDIHAILSVSTSIANKSPTEIGGAMLVPWPHDRLSQILEWSEELLHGHPDLLTELRRRAEELAPVSLAAEFEGPTVVHGDAHFANVLYDGGEVVALLDFEWARLGPRDLELEALCRDEPQIRASQNDGGVIAAELFTLSCLRDSYPDLFEGEHLTERLWLYQICFELRSLCVNSNAGINDRRLSRLRSLADHPWVRFT